MPYRNKVYVAFDGDNDIHYYYLMKAWKQNDGMSFDFNDAHDLNTARDDSLTESIKRQLQIRLNNSKVFVLLVGQSTKNLRRFVPWEIEQAQKLQLPIIVVNLNGKRCLDTHFCPAKLQGETAVHISFNANILEHALEQWPSRHVDICEHLTKDQNSESAGPYYYNDDVYRRLGILD